MKNTCITLLDNVLCISIVEEIPFFLSLIRKFGDYLNYLIAYIVTRYYRQFEKIKFRNFSSNRPIVFLEKYLLIDFLKSIDYYIGSLRLSLKITNSQFYSFYISLYNKTPRYLDFIDSFFIRLFLRV